MDSLWNLATSLRTSASVTSCRAYTMMEAAAAEEGVSVVYRHTRRSGVCTVGGDEYERHVARARRHVQHESVIFAVPVDGYVHDAAAFGCAGEEEASGHSGRPRFTRNQCTGGCGGSAGDRAGRRSAGTELEGGAARRRRRGP